MKTYLVGGAVRDQLLGLNIKERDWVVVGATADMMLELGYRPIGKDFPVFLHPKTHEEYALARTERKTGPGYKGFVFHADKDVTLEEDLKRRDLTINAIAQDDSGSLIDPFNGQQDLKDKCFRHVSPAFSEDPVRILRVARLAGTFPDFTIHPDTQTLMLEMINNGEINALVPDRVWQEWKKAMKQSKPQRFFDVLDTCGALGVLFPVLKENREGYEALDRAVQITQNPTIRLAALLHSLDTQQIKALTENYRIPNDYSDLAVLVSKYHAQYPNISELDAEGLLTLLESLDSFRRKERMDDFLFACEVIYQGDSSGVLRLKEALKLAVSVDAKKFVEQGLKGKEIKEALREARANVIGMIPKS